MACVWNIQQIGLCQDRQSCYCFCGHRERQETDARKTIQFSWQEEKKTVKENYILPEQITKKFIKTSDDRLLLLCSDGIHLCVLKGKKNNEKTKLPFTDMTKTFMKS